MLPKSNKVGKSSTPTESAETQGDAIAQEAVQTADITALKAQHCKDTEQLEQQLVESQAKIDEQRQQLATLTARLDESVHLQQATRNVANSQAGASPLEACEKAVTDILTACGGNNKMVEKRIRKQFSEAELKTKLFVRALVISVMRSCYVDNKFDKEAFTRRCPILLTHIGKLEEMELEALFAIQALDHRMNHQPGLFLFHTFQLYPQKYNKR
jgi:uncharacterized coiled-coil protein SlyX